MNVYDFDNTIYRGDSTVDFIGFCFKTYPQTLKHLPEIGWYGLLYITRIGKKQVFKEHLFHMFQEIKDMEGAVDAFTSSHLDRIKPWYKQTQKEDDLVISASPLFLIRSFCDKIGIRNVIASPVDMKTGKYSGFNCHGKEKVRRFREYDPEGIIEDFYSDSLSDTPLAEIAKRAYLVKGDTIKAWTFRPAQKSKN